jgi:hypothetical protein
MTIFACFGPMISIQGLMIILGIVMGIAFILVGGISFVISKVFRIPMKRILGAGGITLLVCGTISIPLGWEGVAVLILSGAIACGCLLALGGLIKLIREERKTSAEIYSAP